jgi:hypothetical protein
MKRLGILLLAILWSPAWTKADEPREFTEQQLNFFETKIRPVLVTHCYECHAADAKIVQGGLLVDSQQGLLKGGGTGAAIVPGKAQKSLLIQALRHDGIEMPPKGKLPDTVIKDFEAWIAMGAPDPRASQEPKVARTIDIEEGRKHWAFQPVVDSAPPAVKDAAWPVDPLDRFVLSRLEQAGLRPVTDADRYTWLRRVSLDLTGLPPSPGEIGAFVRDNSPRACETDYMGYNVIDGKVHIHDLHATMLHLLGIDHTELTWNHVGRDFRLTDVHGRVVKEIIA